MKSRLITRKTSSLRQIHAAIKLFHDDEYEATITLALAAESQMPHVEVPYLYERLKARVSPDEVDIFNDVRNWLKHLRPPDEIEITNFDAALALVRAVTKFKAVFNESSHLMDEFADWIRQKGGLSPETI
ncbi:hypothetical protein SG09_59290 [Bradyrhizobium ottawaense]|uniref:hypothetical protein n=1 Tax=Bradyrhizobium TaxID=374 RepID=UPI001260E31A|nr:MULTISPECIES: hypothetical protein [Bradyrhizobium]MBR0862899.1 hypothetical protein [Bradyrhizobium diazoefficiens]MBR0887462.1 hypothetical protein [Bradyrhizobium diazoefficiens]MBR0919285.1 hypothetical protein [Bradyrhizobium diazoefficiens]BBO06579.1 hypothetical protein SG09_59290 [Bradyrhizobium ottawaense]